MRKSSRGNPYHDEKGRFCSANRCVSISELTKEEYEDRTIDRFDKEKATVVEFYNKSIKDAPSKEELEKTLDEVLADTRLSESERADIYVEGVKGVTFTHFPTYRRVSAKDFKEQFTKARETQPPYSRWRVSAGYSEADYEEQDCYLASDGACYAIHDGDIVSVCTMKGGLTRGSQLLHEAVKNGGHKLDAYSGLFTFYTKNGFEPISACRWDDEFAPDDWNEDFSREDIVFFKYTGKKQTLTFEEWISEDKYAEDYDSAQKRRDEYDKERV